MKPLPCLSIATATATIIIANVLNTHWHQAANCLALLAGGWAVLALVASWRGE